ncbi:hypothetical protein HDU93_003083, partial [Gonapodya sp. JEL0774]
MNATSSTSFILEPALRAAASVIPDVAFVHYLQHGSKAYIAGQTPYKFAHILNAEQYIPYSSLLPNFPTWFTLAWAKNIDSLVTTVASYAAPQILGPDVAKWIAAALVQTVLLKIVFHLTFWPIFLFYRGADHYGYLDKWKTNPGKDNSNKVMEEKIWN